MTLKFFMERGVTQVVFQLDGKYLYRMVQYLIHRLKKKILAGRMKNAATLDQVNTQVTIEYTAEEKTLLESVRDIWEAILSVDIEDDTDFFASGGGSMDVVR